MNIIVTGGGTAGHVNPGIAIVKYYKKRHPETKILFVGTQRGIESKLAQKEGFEFRAIEVSGLKRSLSLKGILYNLKTSAIALKSVNDCMKIISDFEPNVIIGCGGYASFSMVYAGIKAKISTVVLEVNLVSGLTTKILSKKCDKILLAFEDTKKYLPKGTLDKVLVTGAPTKEEFVAISKEQAKKKLNLLDKPLVVSFWGSLGAKHMNEKMVDFVNNKDDSFYHIHATGSRDYAEFVEKTEKNHSDIREYIFDMDIVMAAADLVLCRAGASTLSEIATMKKPAIIVPSPYVAENHQEKNARILEKAGGCVVLLEKEIDGNKILNECEKLLQDTKRLQDMSCFIGEFAKANSNEEIYKVINNLVY